MAIQPRSRIPKDGIHMAYVVDPDAALDHDVRVRAAQLHTSKATLSCVGIAELMKMPVAEMAKAFLSYQESGYLPVIDAE